MNKESGNTNCLQDIRCPECGQERTFEINVQSTIVCTVIDSGVIAEKKLTTAREWDESNVIYCPTCGQTGTVRSFALLK